MSIKWIAMDMDGTLLNERDEISLKTKEALMKCQKQGIRLLLASGRSEYGLMKYAEELKLEQYGGKLIEVNGMAIYDIATKQREVIRQLNKAEIDYLYPILKSSDSEVKGFKEDTVYSYIPESLMEIKRKERIERNLPDDFPWTGGPWSWLADNRVMYPFIHYFADRSELPDELNKFVVLDDPKVNEKNYHQFKELFEDRFEIVRTCPRGIEITPKGITKGNGLKRLMLEEGIKADEVIAFGDGENDVSMFECVKYGIAMGNAADYVKAKAFDTTDSNRNDGIAKAIEKYVK